MSEQLTFVTVVFDAEVTLLELQAHSLALHANPDDIAQIIVLDNCLFGLSRAARRHLQAAYGPRLWSRVTVVRTRELIDAAAAEGWRSQQAAKLAVAQRVDTPHYVTLDAKNHFTHTVDVAQFVASDGRSRGALHGYATHPLRSSLERTLIYLDATPEVIAAAISQFPPTATPFVFDTAQVREMIADIESRSHTRFGEEFERQELLEFFLYSGWLETRGPGIAAVINGESIPSPTVWPKAATVEGVESTIVEAEHDHAFVFAVHRQVLARADSAVLTRIGAHWVTLGLFPDEGSASRFIRRFRRAYLPALAMTRLAERVRAVRRR